MNNELNPLFEAAMDIAEVVKAKQAAYGDSFGQSGKVLEVLYPNGIPADKFQDALTITRVVDKLFRIANQKEAFDESPWFDIAGYALLSVAKDRKELNDGNESG